MGYLPPVTRPGPSDLARRRTVSTSFEQAREDRGHLQVRGKVEDERHERVTP